MGTKLNSKDKPNLISVQDLFAPCGMFCGFCTSYLSMKYAIPRRRGIISYCQGCRPRNKQCSFIKKQCNRLGKNKIDACHQCDEFPCQVLAKIDHTYSTKFSYSYGFFDANRALKSKGPGHVLKLLKKQHGCIKCGEILCIHNGLCYNCDREQVMKMKNYRNNLTKSEEQYD